MFSRNGLFKVMSQPDRDAIAPLLHRELLVRGQVLEAPGQDYDKAYFIHTGLVANVACSRDEEVGVGIIGHEGMTSVGVLLDARQPTVETRVQSQGDAYSILADDLRKVTQANPDLRSLLLRFAQVCYTQATQNALCNSLGSLGERLARWILMAHDRSQGSDIRVTHAFIALMLGVGRPGITEAIHELEGMLLIRSTRENLHVISRPGLVARAGSFYGVCEAEYSRLIDPTAISQYIQRNERTQAGSLLHPV